MARRTAVLRAVILALAGSAVMSSPAAADAARGAALAQAITRCRDAVNGGQPQSVSWCSKATSGMFLASLDARKAEMLLLFRWAMMVEGRSDGAGVSTAKAVSKMSDPRLAEAQSLTFDAMALQQGFRNWDTRAMARLAMIVDHEPLSGALTEQRVALLRAITAAPRDEASLWVVTALAVTWGTEYRNVTLTRDQSRAYVKDMIGLLTPLLPETRQLGGEARVIHPLIAAALVDLLSASGDYTGAVQMGAEAVPVCRDRLWSDSALCLDLGLSAAMAGERGKILAAHPELHGHLSRAPVVVKGSLQQDSDETDGQSCRVGVRFDLDPAGAVINLQIFHSEPYGKCDALAIRTVSRLTYEAEAASPPNTARTDLLQAVVIRGE